MIGLHKQLGKTVAGSIAAIRVVACLFVTSMSSPFAHTYKQIWLTISTATAATTTSTTTTMTENTEHGVST